MNLEDRFAIIRKEQRAAVKMGCIKCQKSIAGDESRAYGLNKTGEWHAAHADCIQLLEKFNGIEFVEYYNPGLFTKLI